jgi:phosphate/phosphite/phosphonate ABC transporter binding protein
MRRFLAVALVLVLGLSAVGFAQALGTRDNPIIWVFPPSTSPGVIEQIATQIAADISEATGLFIEVSVMPDYAALIEAFKAADGNLMGVPTTDQYARISVETNFETTPRLAASRYGFNYYFSSIYAWRDSGIESIADLNGKVWIYNDEGSTSGYVLPNLLFEQMGLTFAGVVKSGGHTNSITALLDKQGDFCTSYGSPPNPPDGWCGPSWDYGMDPEMWLWDRYNKALYTDGFYGSCVDVRSAAASTGLYGTLDFIVRNIAVIGTVGPVPNDCIAFCPNFPTDVADTLVDAIVAHIESPEGQALWGDPEFYEWTGVSPIDDSYYVNYRSLIGLPNPE